MSVIGGGSPASRASGAGMHASAISAAAKRTPLRLRAVLVERTEDVFDVVLRLGIRGHITVFFNGVRTGVVSGDSKARVAFETIEQAAQIARSPGNVLRGIVGVLHAERGGRLGH